MIHQPDETGYGTGFMVDHARLYSVTVCGDLTRTWIEPVSMYEWVMPAPFRDLNKEELAAKVNESVVHYRTWQQTAIIRSPNVGDAIFRHQAVLHAIMHAVQKRATFVTFDALRRTPLPEGMPRYTDPSSCEAWVARAAVWALNQRRQHLRDAAVRLQKLEAITTAMTVARSSAKRGKEATTAD